MLRILVTNWYDPLIQASVEPLPEGKTFDDLHPIPDFMKVTRVGSILTEKGMKIVEFYEVEDGRLEEALLVQFNREVECMKRDKKYKSNMEILYWPTPPTD